MQLSVKILKCPCNVTTMMNFKKHCLHLARDGMMIKILLYLLQRNLTEARRKCRILMLLLQNSLQFRSPQLGRPLTQEKLPPDPPSKKPASPPPVDDNPIPNNMYLSDSEDTGAAHLLKIKTRPDWLKSLPEEEAPETPKPDWVIPPNDLPETENNWADALAKTYKDPEENKLLRKTRDMGSFINWYCKQIGKSKLVKADLEGPAYKLVKPFHKSSISLHFQTEECHLLLTKQINLMNSESERDYNISAAY
ncbi:hypothetical protein Tco_0136047, partial [Tanacetum coccineum]